MFNYAHTHTHKYTLTFGKILTGLNVYISKLQRFTVEIHSLFVHTHTAVLNAIPAAVVSLNMSSSSKIEEENVVSTRSSAFHR